MVERLWEISGFLEGKEEFSELVYATKNFVNFHNEKRPTNKLYLIRWKYPSKDGFDFSLQRDFYAPSGDGIYEKPIGVTNVINLNYYKNIIEVVDNEFDSRFEIANNLSKQYESIIKERFNILRNIEVIENSE